MYLTDRQGSVLQIVGGDGSVLKRVEYSGLSATRTGSAASDRFELGGRMFDRDAGLSMFGGQWYNPDLGRYLTEGGRVVGLNPYPVAGNSLPNVGGSGADSWAENMKPFGHDFFERLGQQVSQGLGFRSDEGGKIAAGLWSMAYGFTPLGIGENLAPRDLATGRLQAPGDWSTDSTNRMAHGVRLNFDGYRARGFDQVEAIIMTGVTNLPGFGSEVKRLEMLTGTSYQGTTFGDKLKASDYVLNTVSIGVDVAGTVMGGVGVLGRIGGAAGRTGAVVTRLGRVANRVQRVASGVRTGIEGASVVTGIPSP
ncbi:MAG TPA: hypothetical protein VGE74_23820 [Gemmata sp.]